MEVEEERQGVVVVEVVEGEGVSATIELAGLVLS